MKMHIIKDLIDFSCEVRDLVERIIDRDQISPAEIKCRGNQINADIELELCMEGVPSSLMFHIKPVRRGGDIYELHYLDPQGENTVFYTGCLNKGFLDEFANIMKIQELGQNENGRSALDWRLVRMREEALMPEPSDEDISPETLAQTLGLGP